MRRLAFNRQILVACIILGCFVAVAIMAPRWAPPDDPDQPGGVRVVGTSHSPLPQPPSDEAPLGTTTGQVDIYYSLIWGSRSALRFGLIVTLSTAVIGTLVGAIGGYSGGMVHGLLMRVTDAFLAFPVIAGVWLLLQVMRPASAFAELTPIQQALRSGPGSRAAHTHSVFLDALCAAHERPH
jgi:peptide/nickel transport system permease protein